MTQEGRNQMMVRTVTLGRGISDSGELPMYHLRFQGLVFVLHKRGQFTQTHGLRCYLSNNRLYLQISVLGPPTHLINCYSCISL